MSPTLLALITAALLLPQAGTSRSSSGMKDDVGRMVRAAEKVNGTWPSQAPPAVREVELVVGHGRTVAPLLLALLSDDPDVERDRRRWPVQQQAALALCRIYSESEHCGRTYCDGDPRERIGGVREGWRRLIESDAAMRALPAMELLERFKQETVFWRQGEIGEVLATTGNRDVIAALAPSLTYDDRHLRGNAALVIGRLGDSRGFDTIAEILTDRSPRGPGQGIPGGRWSVQAQIRADRYYAAHLLGDLRDPRGVELLVPLLDDEDVDDVVPWSLAKIGDRRAIGPLIARLDRDDPSARVLAIHALEQLNARDALPGLRELLRDQRRPNFGERVPVGEAARRAIDVISLVR